MENPTWSVLIVCTGNICRSPMVERLAVGRLAVLANAPRAPGHILSGARPAVSGDTRFAVPAHVHSAGVQAWSGEPMFPHAAAVLAERGADPSGFRARKMTKAMIDDADLILCATRVHRAAVATLAPRRVRQAFTLREFGRLTTLIEPARVRSRLDAPATGATAPDLRSIGCALTAAASALRGSGPPTTPGDDDLPDPLGRDLAAFRACADTIEVALEAPIRLLHDLLVP